MADQNIIEIKFKATDADKLTREIKKLDKATKSLVNAQAKLVNQNNANRTALANMSRTLGQTNMSFKKLGFTKETVRKAFEGNKLAVDRLRIAYNRYQRFLKSVNTTTKKAVDVTDRHKKGLFALSHSARQTGGAFSVLRSKLLLFNFAMGLGIRQVMKFAEEASQLEALETAFNTLSGGGENASTSLNKLKQATDGTVTSMDLFQQANNAMILGVTKNSDEMAEMFDMAQRLGRALGRDTRSSIESFVTGVGRQSRLMLDNIGLIVKAEVAYKAFAKEVGKNADELDEMERKQAFLNASLFAGEEALRSLGAETLSSADKLQQMSTELIEVRQQIGEELLPFVLEATKAVKEFAENIDGDDIRNAIATIETLTTAFVSFKAITLGVQGALVLLSLSLPQVALIATVGTAIGELALMFQQASKRALDLKSKQNELGKSLRDAQKDLKDYIVFLQNFDKNRENAVSQIKAEAELRIEKNNEAMRSFIDYLSLLKLGQQEFEEIRKLESKRLQIRKKLEDEFKNLSLANKDEIISSLVEIEIEKMKILTQDEQRLKRQEEFQKIRESIEKVHSENITALNEQSNDERTKLQKQIFDRLMSSEEEFIQLRMKNVKDMSDAELQALDDALKFFEEREELKKLVLGDTTAFRLQELNTLAEALQKFGLNDARFTTYIEEQKKLILKEGAEARKKIAKEASQEDIDGLNMLAGSINALSGAFDVLSDSQASASAKMSAFLRMAGGLLSVLGGSTPAGAFGGVLSAFGGAIGHTGGYIKQDGSIQRFARGGMVQGQDNVPIMAQAGEFIIRRSVVEDIGVNKLAELNNGQTGVGSTININIDGNVIGNEEFVRGTLIPEIRRTIGRGLA